MKKPHLYTWNIRQSEPSFRWHLAYISGVEIVILYHNTISPVINILKIPKSQHWFGGTKLEMEAITDVQRLFEMLLFTALKYNF